MPPLSEKCRKEYQRLCKAHPMEISVGKDILLVKNHDLDFWGTEMWNLCIRHQDTDRFQSVQALSRGNLERYLGISIPSFGNIT